MRRTITFGWRMPMGDPPGAPPGALPADTSQTAWLSDHPVPGTTWAPPPPPDTYARWILAWIAWFFRRPVCPGSEARGTCVRVRNPVTMTVWPSRRDRVLAIRNVATLVDPPRVIRPDFRCLSP